jgi:hypothetical protein
MPDRPFQLVRIAVMILAALLVYQCAQIVRRWNPLSRVVVPALPTLVDSSMDRTNAPAAKGIPSNAPATPSTNVASAPKGTNAFSTNSAISSNTVSTNIAVTTNATSPALVVAKTTNHATNDAAKAPTSTNVAPTVKSNSIAARDAEPAPPSPDPIPGGMDPKMMMTMAMMNGGMMPGIGGKPPPPLAPAVSARISKITQSELLAPVIHPMPAALLGIAGNTAFLRAASGQTGLVKEGKSLGELKLVQIGVNRVLVEENGESKELMIFSGFGGESLLSKTNVISHESKNAQPNP